MSNVTIISSNQQEAQSYVNSLEWAGGTAALVIPNDNKVLEFELKKSGGLLLTSGPDINPVLYGPDRSSAVKSSVYSDRDSLDLAALSYALEHNMPILAISRGMQLLNVAMGGRLIQGLSNHQGEFKDGEWVPITHEVYVSPGSKLAAIMGRGGFFKVNSLHDQGLKDAHKSPRLLASVYSLEDGVIEGLESPEHDWVIGLQCLPHRFKEIPLSFRYIFKGFVERSERYLQRS